MALTQPQKAKLAGLAAAISAMIGIVAISAIDYSGPVVGALGDAGFSSATQGGTVADVLSEPIEPGATGSTYLAFPGGSTGFEVVGPANFTIVSTSIEQSPAPPGSPSMTVFTIVFTNNAADARRFVGFVNYVPPPTGG